MIERIVYYISPATSSLKYPKKIINYTRNKFVDNKFGELEG